MSGWECAGRSSRLQVVNDAKRYADIVPSTGGATMGVGRKGIVVRLRLSGLPEDSRLQTVIADVLHQAIPGGGVGGELVADPFQLIEQLGGTRESFLDVIRNESADDVADGGGRRSAACALARR